LHKSQTVSQAGYILDGFPRNLDQARLLQEKVEIDHAVNFVASDSTVVERITGRRTCKNCGAIYHITFIPPKRDTVCDLCNGDLFQREDDKEEAVRNRLKVYREQTKPLITYYKNKGILLEVDAEKTPDAVMRDTMAVLDLC